MPSLTDILRHLDPAERMERRRRIYAIADWWALYLAKKYGGRGEALAACRRRQLATAKADASIRNHIWEMVYRSIK